MRWRSVSLLWVGLLLSGPAWAQTGPEEAPASPEEAAAAAEGAGAQATALGGAAAPEGAAEDYEQRIYGLEHRINDLKEEIFRSKARLTLLKESVLSNAIAGAEARIVHRNEMGGAFRLEKVSYSLDGAPIRSLIDKDGELAGQEEIEILSGPIVPGNHTLSVNMVYRGSGYGVFSYLRGYVFNLKSSHTFRAQEGKLIQLKAVGYEKGGMTTDLKDRPSVRFESTLVESTLAPAAAEGANLSETTKN